MGATTVYQDQNAPQVQALRQFRDEILAKSYAGRVFIDAYYNGLGERCADFVQAHPSLVPVVRKGLDKLVAAYTDSKDSAE